MLNLLNVDDLSSVATSEKWKINKYRLCNWLVSQEGFSRWWVFRTYLNSLKISLQNVTKLKSDLKHGKQFGGFFQEKKNIVTEYFPVYFLFFTFWWNFAPKKLLVSFGIVSRKYLYISYVYRSEKKLDIS
jgi:hypothetical protein